MFGGLLVGAGTILNPSARMEKAVLISFRHLERKIITLFHIDLMKECGWLTVKLLMVYHSLLQVHKTRQQQAPAYLYERISHQLGNLEAGSNYYKTRQEAQGLLRKIAGVEVKLAFKIQDRNEDMGEKKC